MTRRPIQIAPGLFFPLDLVTSTLALVAIRGAGKTYTGCVFAEELAAAILHFVVIDPEGAWWGLRSSADGRSPGIPIVVLGGEHGDAPLDATTGSVVADLAVNETFSMILDLKLMEKGEQIAFVRDFARRLFHKNREPLFVFVDEADKFAPQVTKRKDQVESLDALDDCIRRGRGRGIGMGLITQRAAVLNWDLLSQVETLIALRTISELDVNALHGWLKRAKKEMREEFLTALPTLKAGEAFVWSPAFLEVFDRFQIRQRRTFDSSATPKPGQRSLTPRALAEVPIDTIRARMATTIARAAENDPVALRGQLDGLRGRIEELETQLAERPAVAAETKVEVVERPVVLAHERKTIVEATLRLQEVATAMSERLGEWATKISAACESVVGRVSQVEAESQDIIPFREEMAPPATPYEGGFAPVYGTVRPAKRTNGHDQRGGLGSGHRRILENVARFDQRGGLTIQQLATLCGMSAKGGGFRNYVGFLRSGRLLIEARGDRFHLTQAGRDLVATWTIPPLTRAGILALWAQQLGGGERRMLDILVQRYPNAIAVDELAKAVQMQPTGGGFRNYLGRLRTNALAENTTSGVRAGPALFLR